MSNSLRPDGLQPTRFLCPWHVPRQECWNGLPFPIPEYLPNPGIQPVSRLSPAVAGAFFTPVPHCEYTKLPFSLLFAASEIQSLPMQIKAITYAGEKKILW